MIATVFVLTLLAALVGGVALIAIATKQRRGRLALMFGAQCLLCGSREVDVLVAPEYRCRECGFDTTKTAGLTEELQHYAELLRICEAARRSEYESPNAENYRRELAELRHTILAQMSTDGAVEGQRQLDFEHVIARDYDGL